MNRFIFIGLKFSAPSTVIKDGEGGGGSPPVLGVAETPVEVATSKNKHTFQ